MTNAIPQKSWVREIRYGFFLSVALLTFSPALAASYVVSGDVLTVTVGTGETEPLDASKITADIAKIVKAGSGTLVSSADLSGWKGAIEVAAGRLRYTTVNSLGDVTEGGAVTVKSGATLDASFTATASLGGKTIYFEGTGSDGKGALYVTHNNKTQNSGCVFGTNLVMTGSALIGGGGSSYFVYFSNTTLDMGGFELTHNGYFVYTTGFKVVNPGSFVRKGCAFDIRDDADFGGSSDNVMTVNYSSYGGLQMTGTTVPLKWTVVSSDKFFGDMGGRTADDNKNVISGPVQLTAGWHNVFCYYNNYGVTFSGDISGTGGFRFDGSVNKNSSIRRYPNLNLLSPQNTFTGGICGSLGALNVYANGAVPANGGDVALTNSYVNFKNDQETYGLPNAILDATDPALSATGTVYVTGGRGSWKESLTKTGPGLLKYESSVGAPELEVRGGRMDIVNGYSAKTYYGLNFGTNVYANKSEALSAYQSNVAFTNNRLHHIEYAYAQGNRSDTYPNRLWLKNFLVTYTGYVWNRSPTNETWSFAMNGFDSRSLTIDGEKIIDVPQFMYKIAYFANKVMTPGPHPISIRFYNDNDSYAGTHSSASEVTNATWKAARGLVYDRLGRGSTNIVDYSLMEDDKNGTLFTTEIPGSVAAVAPLPSFPSMKFAVGTALVYPFRTVLAPEALAGWPSFTNVLALTVRDWTVTGEEVGQGSLATDGSLTFTDDAVLTIQTAKRFHLASGPFLLARAEGGIFGLPTVVSDRKWALAKSVDGKSLYVTYIAPGMCIIVR